MTTQSIHHIGVKEPQFILSLLASLLVHAVVFVVLFFVANQSSLPETPPIEASLVAGSELSDIQAQIASAYAANQVSQQSQAQMPTTTQPTTSYNDDIARRERAYQAQMQEYADNLEQEILSEMRLQRQRLDEEDKERQRQVDELQSRERSNDEIARENSKELQKKREHIEQMVNEAKSSSNSNHASSHNADHHGTPSTPNVGKGGVVGSGQSGANRGQAQANITSRVQAIWERYDNPPNRRLSATISIDDEGNLQGIRFGAGDKDLEPSLQASIKEAAPFPEMAGIAKTFTINFSTK